MMMQADREGSTAMALPPAALLPRAGAAAQGGPAGAPPYGLPAARRIDVDVNRASAVSNSGPIRADSRAAHSDPNGAPAPRPPPGPASLAASAAAAGGLGAAELF